MADLTLRQLSVMVASAAHCWFEPISFRLAMDPELDLTSDDISWLINILAVGSVIGALVSGDLTNRIGRKHAIMSIGPICLAGWILILWSKSMLSLIAARILQGIAVGVAITIPPIYTAEIADPRLRGGLSGTFEVVWDLGTVYSFSFGPFVTYDMFVYACLPLPIIFSIMWMFVPETPYYLLMAQREEEAKKSLEYFRDGDIEEEFEDMQKAVLDETSKGGAWKTLFCDKFERKAFIVLQIVSISKYLSGMTVFLNYALDTFSNSEFFFPSEGMSIFIAAIFTVIDIITAFLSDWVGRKPLALFSCFGCFLAHFLLGIYFYLLKTNHISATDYTLALYLGMALYCIFSDIGIGPLLQTLQSEMFGASTRGIAAGITQGIASLLSLVVIKLFTPVYLMNRIYLHFWFYAFVSIVGGVLLSSLMNETAGKLIGQIENKTKKSTNTSGFGVKEVAKL